jgi:hypothetical protein
MSYWVGRFIRTDDGEHGRVLDRKVLRRLSRRQLVELIEAKDVELVAWDEGEQLELVADEYLADEGTHVSLSASDEAARPPRRPRTLFPVAVVVTCLALSATGVVLAHVLAEVAGVHAVIPGHVQAPRPSTGAPSTGAGTTGPVVTGTGSTSRVSLAQYPYHQLTRYTPSPYASPTMVTTTTLVPTPEPTTSPSPSYGPSPSSPAPGPPAMTPALTPDPG